MAVRRKGSFRLSEAELICVPKLDSGASPGPAFGVGPAAVESVLLLESWLESETTVAALVCGGVRVAGVAGTTGAGVGGGVVSAAGAEGSATASVCAARGAIDRERHPIVIINRA